MPQAVMLIDGVQVAAKGFMAPKKNRSLDDWTKDLIEKVFNRELEKQGMKIVDHKKHVKSQVTSDQIRLLYDCGGVGVGFFVDRKANWV